MIGFDAASPMVAAMSLAVATGALIVAVVAIRRADVNSSAACIVTLYDGFAETWRRFTREKNDELRDYEFAEMMNVLEIGCAIYLDKAVYGRSRKILGAHLARCLLLLKDNTYASQKIEELRHSPDTFEYVLELESRLGTASAKH